MIFLHKKDILISEHDHGSAAGFVSTPSLVFYANLLYAFFSSVPLSSLHHFVICMYF